MVRGASFTIGFDFNGIMHVGLFGFMQKIVGNLNNFELYVLFDFEPMKLFECQSDVYMLRSVGKGVSECILNLLQTFDFDDWK